MVVEYVEDDNEPHTLYSFEPDATTLFDALLPRYVTTRVYAALLESAASELASRQRAMKSASDNADDLIKVAHARGEPRTAGPDHPGNQRNRRWRKRARRRQIGPIRKRRGYGCYHQKAEKSTNSKSSDTNGRVVRITGPVVDVEFPRGSVPQLFNALHAEITYEELAKTLTLEVAQHLGDNLVRTISMQPTDGLVRGVEVTDTGKAISVPVGDGVKGHVFNALGDCLDEPGYGEDFDHWSIHRKPPPFDELEPRTEMLETGLKVVDLLTPYVRGGKIALFGGAGRGQDGADPGDDQPYRPKLRWYFGIRRRGGAHP